MKCVLIAVLGLWLPVAAWADHLKPRFYIFPPKPDRPAQSFSVQQDRFGIVHRILEEGVQVVGQFMPLSPALTAINCVGVFNAEDGTVLAHGDVLEFVDLDGYCTEVVIQSRDPEVTARIEAEWRAQLPPPAPEAAAPADPPAPEPETAEETPRLVTVPRPAAPQALPPVRDVQQSLADLGYDPGPADNIPGRRTDAAISAFRAGHPNLTQSTGLTLEFWQNLSLTAQEMQRELTFNGRRIRPVAVFWVTVVSEGERAILGGGRPGFDPAMLADSLARVDALAAPGDTVLLWVDREDIVYVVGPDAQ